ncbi:SDR family NAD(P)-dependent oxidoreductase [Parashewanella spongiae]|uniref:SDR family NAD(P)-dependent oxidoreductase n=1 Tax=Parashewanella spongiae TaxID=342950 RepID=A0A3A6UGN5_9GAMM|nr:SDR family NAD(P)-dependent oxidoreductase [Parashewanella spongiae]
MGTVPKQFGAITHLVNNAGSLMKQSRLIDISAERIRKVINTNVIGSFICCREAIKHMPFGGSIVNVGSAASRLGAPNEYIDYAASKGAIDSLTTGLSLELAAQNIRVNCVRPGCIYP